jgi:lipoate-protein ligase A
VDVNERWIVEEARGAAAALHGDVAFGPERVVRVCTVDAPALVLGSTQRDDVVDRDATERAGVEVVRRRSGGGVVLVEPGAQVWLDVWVPAQDVLWRADVGVSFAWLGEAWCRALATFGLDANAHADRLECGRWGRLVCFAGRGPGEVAVGDRKVVGLSQHRSRAGARFHAAALLRWEPRRLVELLALDAETRADAAADLELVAAPLATEGASLTEALVAALP